MSPGATGSLFSPVTQDVVLLCCMRPPPSRRPSACQTKFAISLSVNAQAQAGDAASVREEGGPAASRCTGTHGTIYLARMATT